MKFEVVIEKELDDPGYFGYSPALPGCFSNGKTIVEARENMREAIRQHIEALRANGQFLMIKVREIIRIIEQDGWVLDRTRGSHRQYKHPVKRGLVTVAGKPSDDLAHGTHNSILKQAGLK